MYVVITIVRQLSLVCGVLQNERENHPVMTVSHDNSQSGLYDTRGNVMKKLKNLLVVFLTVHTYDCMHISENNIGIDQFVGGVLYFSFTLQLFILLQLIHRLPVPLYTKRQQGCPASTLPFIKLKLNTLIETTSSEATTYITAITCKQIEDAEDYLQKHILAQLDTASNSDDSNFDVLPGLLRTMHHVRLFNNSTECFEYSISF